MKWTAEHEITGISQGRSPGRVKSLNSTSERITRVYDHKDRSVHLFLLPGGLWYGSFLRLSLALFPRREAERAPTPLPTDQNSHLDDFYFADSPTQDLFVITEFVFTTFTPGRADL